MCTYTDQISSTFFIFHCLLQCFLGDKYGSRLLPHYIEAKEFKLLRRIAMRRGYDVTIMDEWFERDDNAEPAVYRLRSIDEIFTHYDDNEHEDLQKKVYILKYVY